LTLPKLIAAERTMPLPDLLATVADELILVPVTLLPIINPLGTASVFVSTVGGRRDVAKRLARQIAVNSFVVIVVAMLVGTYVLSLFGISLPVVRIGGGLLMAFVLLCIGIQLMWAGWVDLNHETFAAAA